jgi:transglutaminase-like putative cysteine protease
MSPSHQCVVTILVLASIYSILCSSAALSFSSITQNEDSGFLKFEISDVYVGNLTHTIEITNDAPVRVKGGKLFVPLVTNATARHYVILFDVYASNKVQSEILEDDFGNIYAFWDGIEIGREQNFSVRISYHMLSFNTHYRINSSLVASYNRSSYVYMRHTKPEKLIESDRKEIVSTAENIVGNETNPHKKVMKIYDFVTKHVHYMAQDEEMGALWALENKTGDCSEYSYLFVALCRAAEIPARIQAGFAFHSFSETTEDGHMWAEYYLEDYGWIPVDSTWQLFDTLDDRHFSSIQSTPEVIPYANYVFNCTSGQAEDEQRVSITPCSISVFEDDSFAENLVKTVSNVKRAKFAIFLGKVFGTPLVFPSEAESIEQEFLECEVYLQNAVELWNRQPQFAHSSVTSALDSAEAALENAWILIVKVFAILLSVPIAILLVALVLLKRCQVK